MAVFDRLNDDGHTIILVTHEEDIAGHSRRVVKLHDGEVALDEVVVTTD